MENIYHTKNLRFSGRPVEEANRVLIMLHGRGGTAEDILTLSDYFQIRDYALIAPQATNYTWYPNSFLAPLKENEPWLSSSLELIRTVVRDLNDLAITTEMIYLLGFSQGACLALEFAARNAARFGGIAAFTGGLIGERIYAENYRGDFENTPVFIGTSDPDMHVPVERVNVTAETLRRMNAEVTLKIYKNMGHTISPDEILSANQFVFSK